MKEERRILLEKLAKLHTAIAELSSLSMSYEGNPKMTELLESANPFNEKLAQITHKVESWYAYTKMLATVELPVKRTKEIVSELKEDLHKLYNWDIDYIDSMDYDKSTNEFTLYISIEDLDVPPIYIVYNMNTEIVHIDLSFPTDFTAF